jgi:hypothetical protein
MPGETQDRKFEEARRDLHYRTLSKLDGEFASLVYLASTRDYNTGQYVHDGLAAHFSEPIAERALAAAHREIFKSLALSPLKVLVSELEHYIRSGGGDVNEVLNTWRNLEPYRMLVPTRCELLIVELFISNIKIALAIVEPDQVGDR